MRCEVEDGGQVSGRFIGRCEVRRDASAEMGVLDRARGFFSLISFGEEVH